jgi:hypothetical protein
MKSTFDVNLLTFPEILVAYFSQASPSDDVKPFRFFMTFTIR